MAYIAGPYQAEKPYLFEQNIRRAEKYAVQCKEQGLHFICPHTQSRFMEGLGDDEYWLAATLNMLQRCDLMILTVPLSDAMQSEGTRGELEFAVNNGIPVYRFVGDALRCGLEVSADAIVEFLRRSRKWTA